MARQIFPFGSGRMFLKQATDLGYIRVGVAAMQEGSWAVETDIKQLHGANRFPVDVRTGMGKIDGTAKFTDWDPLVIGLILQSQVIPGVDVVHIVNTDATGNPLVAAATVTVTPPTVNTIAGQFLRNLEVVYKATGTTPAALVGMPLTQVTTVPSSPPNTGKFSVAVTAPTATYSFGSDDVGYGIQITYVYSVASGTGVQKIDWNNVIIGLSPVCAGVFQGISDAKQMVMELNQVVPHGLKWASRIDDWSHIDIGLSAFADANDDIGFINLLTNATAS
jgi:hypothetical protein